MKNPRLPETIDDLSIIGATCTQARLSDMGILVLGFGELVPFKYSKLKERKHGIVEIRSYSCSWRVFVNGKLKTGQYDDEDKIKPIIDEVLGKKLLRIEISESLSDAILTFSNGIFVNFYDISSAEKSWEIFGPKSWIGIGPGDKCETTDNNTPSGMSDEEHLMENHAEESNERWKFKVPHECETGQQCRNCAYYCPLQGKFFFWDYGLCSNQTSLYDGKVVNVESGCDFYSSELKQIR